MMSIIKRLPWISLLVVMLTYSIFGWILSGQKLTILKWVLIIISLLLLIASLTIPSSKSIKYIKVLFDTKFKSFMFAIFGAFVFFLMLAYFRIFLDIMLIISATILLRLEFQIAGLKDIQAFYFTSLFAAIGLTLGILSFQFAVWMNW